LGAAYPPKAVVRVYGELTLARSMAVLHESPPTGWMAYVRVNGLASSVSATVR
jgi:hypothetical protein